MTRIMTRISMRIWARTFLLCLELAAMCCVAAAIGQAGPLARAQPQYRITGTLVSSADGSPVPHGHLVALRAGRGAEEGQRFPADQTGFDADDQGRFVITLPSAGVWDVIASGRGFTQQAYLAHEQFATGVVLANSHPVVDIRFQLDPEAEIAGVVQDDAGEPVRGAQVLLMRVLERLPDHSEPAMTLRTTVQTDDRGMYEFDGLAPGSYKVCVHAQPWYAVAATRGLTNVETDPPLDPSLDVAYPATWFPGVDDPDAAETLALRGGDVKEADLHLRAVPSVHLLVNPPAVAAVEGPHRGLPVVSAIERVDSATGGMDFIQPTQRRDAQGQIDLGGLTPGLYQVATMMPGGENRSSVVRVTANGAQTLSYDKDSGEARVSVHVDGLPESEANALRVSLLDPVSGSVIATSRMGGDFRGGFVRLQGVAAGAAANARSAKEPDQILEVPPGRYEIAIQGRPNVFLRGVTAKGAQATGRDVTLPPGESSLLLHVVEGRATLTGFASSNGKPSIGAVVMLVPAALGQPGAIQIVRRDQSNSDGSFDIAAVIPGQYILIAVENGWDINWKDASTLVRYLTGGVAVDLSSGADATQNVVAQQP